MKSKLGASSKIYMALILIFLYLPIFVLVFFSFNSSENTSMFTGFSLRWYKELIHDTQAMGALKNTLILALTSSAISTVFGTATAVGMIAIRQKWIKSPLMTVTNLPMVNPEIVTGISMMLLFVSVGALLGKTDVLGFSTLLIAHVTFNLPYIILSVLPKLKQLDPHLYEAAQDLGSPPVRSFFKVVLPSILPGIVTGMVMTFTMSLDDFIISYFTNGPGFTTLPVYIFSMTKKRVKPDMYALSALIFVTILVLLIVINLVQIRGERHKNKRGLRSRQ